MRVVSVAGILAVAAGVIVGPVNLASLCPWLLRAKVGIESGVSRRARVRARVRARLRLVLRLRCQNAPWPLGSS